MTDPTPETTPTRDEAVPTGWKLVPVVPTLEMQKAYFDEIDRNMSRVENDCTFGRFDNHRVAYAKMLASAPAPAPASSGVDAVLNLYREAVRIDVKMEGPQFMGANSSALKRAWEADRASLSPAATQKGPADCSTGPVRDHDPVATAATPVSEDGEATSYSTAADPAKPTTVSEAGSCRCAICGGEHDNDALSDICRRCEETAPWREEPLAKPASSPAGGDVREALEALKPFANIANEYADQEDDDFQVWKDFDVLGASLPLRIFRRARAVHQQLAALSQSTSGRVG